MTQKWLNASEWEQVIANHLYTEVDEIGIRELKYLYDERKMTVRVPSCSNSKMPFDYLIWSKTSKKNHDKHQPRYVKLNIFDSPVNSIRCVEFQNQAVTKNIVPFKEFIYVHYTVHNNMFTVPDPKSRKRRLEGYY
uniref:Uncharacterized protein n=1 Tax=Caenorhabditis japonica TaxID=281687 RepID=A0A8R1HWI6_CAEJA